MSMSLFTSRHLFNSCPTSRKMMELWSCLFKDCYPKDVSDIRRRRRQAVSQISPQKNEANFSPLLNSYHFLCISVPLRVPSCLCDVGTTYRDRLKGGPGVAWLPLTAMGEFTQPMIHLLADLCTSLVADFLLCQIMKTPDVLQFRSGEATLQHKGRGRGCHSWQWCSYPMPRTELRRRLCGRRGLD